MKKNFKYAILSAIALVGAVSLTSCSSSDDVDESPNIDGPVVKTQFTISLPGNVVNSTRQSAATVQDAQTVAAFRGFDNIVLIPYASVSANNVSGNRLTTTSIVLTPAGGGAANTLPGGSSGGLDATNNNNSYVYSDVKIPVGTSGFLFYAKAPDSGEDKFVNGSLTAAPEGLSGQNSGFSFSLVPIKSGNGNKDALLQYVNSIASATGWSSSTNTGIKDLYDKFITLKAGSSRSIRAALEDLYESLKDNADDVSQAVCTAILTKAVYSATPNATTGYKLTLDSSVDNYPSALNIPDGAVALKWTSGTAAWAADNASAGGESDTWNTGTNTLTPLANYVYPASLYYRADSPVKTSTSKQATYYSSKDGWNAIVTDLYTSGATVTNETQSVALVEQIQYAVAQLCSTIKINGNASAVYDRKGDVINIGTGEGKDGTFKMTGILIGNQKNVDWQFLPTGDTYYTIYDTDVPSPTITASDGVTNAITNYTLALESATNTNVFVAVEFENNAKDFIGKEGLVAKGTRFYLVAELKPNEATNKDATGLTQVFKQDYKTTATFTIPTGVSKDTAGFVENTTNTTGLSAAYNVIPDLRTPLMELGLSVNLSWQTGLNFNVGL